MPRIKRRKSLMLPPLEGSKEYERFGTPLIVAEYRAERLKCRAIAEIGASVGFQTYAFAQVCGKVCAIEINSEKFGLLKRNMSQYDNVTLINGDALDETIIKKVQKFKPDVVFVDTQRPEFEKKRTLESLQPNIQRILKEYGKITEEISIEVPPQIREIPFDCEKEYISLYNKLNRLTLYFGNLKECDTRVVFLPGKEEIKGVPHAGPVEDFSFCWRGKGSYSYIYEINPAVTRAGLAHIIAEKVAGKLFKEGSKIYVIASKFMNTPMAKPYKIIKVVNRPLKVGKRVVLKGHVKSDEFLMLKKQFEGNKKRESKILRQKSEAGNIVFVFGSGRNRRFVMCEETGNVNQIDGS